MIFNVSDQSNYISDPVVFKSTQGDSAILFVAGDFGAGQARIEVKMGNSWYEFAELTFTKNTAKRIAIPSGATIRLNIDGTTSVSAILNYYSE